MAVLNVDLRRISSVESSIKSAVKAIDRRQSDYEGIIKDVNGVQSNSGNLSNCNIYLKKKNQQLQGKMDKLNSFQKKLSTFSSNAEAADKRVATYISDESDTFYKTVGIKTGWSRAWQNIKKGATKLWEGIKKFYNDHKYIIDFVVDLVMFAVAVVSLIAAIPTGGATLVFSVFAIAQSLGDLFTSAVALGFHIAGDDEQAGIWAERGLKDGVKLLGRGLDWVAEKLTGVQTDFFENLGGFAYDVMSIASIGYGLWKAGSGIFKTIKNGNIRKFSLSTVKTVFGLDLTPGSSKKGYKAIIKAFSFIKNGKQAYNLVRVCGHIKNIKTIVKIANSVFDGTFFTEGLNIVSTIKKLIDTNKSAGRHAELGDFQRTLYVIGSPVVRISPTIMTPLTINGAIKKYIVGGAA